MFTLKIKNRDVRKMLMISSQYGVNLVHNLKEIVWTLNKDNAITGDSDTVSTIEEAIEEIEELRENNLNSEEIFNVVAEWSDKDIKELEDDLKQHRLYNVRFNDNETTVDMVANKVIEWYGMSLKELRALADSENLKQSGTKEELVRRLKNKYLDEHEVVL